ncbi:putative calcium-binding protein CML18 [Acorus calamus]|uniref:Calcium-binding protein CML18 n=1 Tax=Acorus calamus TaxID=4465 RepID=A0AAV9DPB1_ACOCL|nr:putative calcium-binding protein CML18 [Acorus calamus]
MATTKDPQEMEEVEKVFRRFDANGDGKISSEELLSVLRALGSAVSDAELRQMMDEMDSDRDGFVDLKEFSEFHLAGGGIGGGSDGGGGEDLRDAFEMYDLDKNGLISAAELHQVLRMLGERCSVRDCQKMIRSVDSDGDGCVSFVEFKQMMKGGFKASPSPSPR